MTLLMRSCRQATALMVAQEDHPLAWSDRLALRLHLAVCATCPTMQRQLLTMRNSLQQWRHYGDKETSEHSDTTL